ncbi:MAG: MauE/DoxX family redox-associated membrane protein [Minisyncoccia bacterium]
MLTVSDSQKIIGTSLNLSEWTLFKGKTPVEQPELIPHLLKETYRRTVDSTEYSMGVYYFHDIISVIAYGPVGTCCGHVFLNADKTYEKVMPGCIDFEKFKHTSHAQKYFKKYLPILTFLLLAIFLSALTQIATQDIGMMQSMQYYMAYFFIIFGILKITNLKNFAEMYSLYDIVAIKYLPWGYIYPFIEVLLGSWYMFDPGSLALNSVTAIMMSITSLGIYNHLNKGTVTQCACLGGYFNVPISWVTFIENFTMLIMALFMLANTLGQH